MSHLQVPVQPRPPYPVWAQVVPDTPPIPSPSPGIRYLPGRTYISYASLTRHIAYSVDVSRLTALYPLLWFAGRPGYIRPLHRQHQMQREIVITEQADLHLTWMDDRIHVKPLPAWLLNHNFYNEHVAKSAYAGDAHGFLSSWVKLVRWESDMRIAQELGLVPSEVTWEAWTLFAAALDDADGVSKRYVYGELRLFRLNMIYRFWRGHLIGGYHLYHTNLSSFFRRNFTWPLVAFAYATAVLNAMQVVLASNYASGVCRRAAYGFGLWIVIMILFSMVAVFSFFLVLLVYNLTKALWRRDQTRRRERDATWRKEV